MDTETRYCTCGHQIVVQSRGGYIIFIDPDTWEEVVECPGCQETVITWLCQTNDGLILDETALLTEHPDIIAGRKAEVSKIKSAINNAIPTSAQVTSIIIALTEIQKDMAELLYKEITQ